METATGTLMFGIFALASLPMMLGLLVWGLAAETSPHGASGLRLADQGRRDYRDERRDDLRRVA